MKTIFRKIAFWWRYRKNPAWDSGISPPELMKHIHENEPGRALDLGCGTGTNVITLAHYGWKAQGIDFISTPIKAAKRKARAAGVDASFFVDDVTNPSSISGTYDLILDMGCFHSLSLEGKNKYQETIKRSLSPGGTFLLYGFTHHPDGARITNADQAKFSKSLELVSERTGQNGVGRTSIWLEYQKPRFNSSGIK